MSEPTTEFDGRFSDPAASATPWPVAEQLLREAELFWLSTVRADGRPHVTPLLAVWEGGALHFCCGPGEQKARNLQADPRCALTTGVNTWSEGFDVVVEGTATRITDEPHLRALAAAWEAKYGDAWHFDVAEHAFRGGGDEAWVFAVAPEKVLGFAKDPHAQTRWRFSAD